MKHKKNHEEVPAAESSGATSPAAQEAAEVKPEPVCEEADKAKAQAADYYDQLIRLKAEFENYCKRTEKQRPEWIDYGKQQVICKLLPLYDALTSAKAQLEKSSAVKDGVCVSPELVKGIEMIFSEFERVLQSEGITPMECLGRPYDPHSHEAVAVLPSDAANDGMVMAEVQKGFTCGSKVIRPARVCIGRKKEEEGGKEAPAREEGK